MKYIFGITLIVFSISGYAQKIDSSLIYRWADSRPDSNLWDKTYGWYDTTRLAADEGLIWIMDIVSRQVLVEPSGWVVTLRFPPPKNCRCWGKYIFEKYLDAEKKSFPRNSVVRTSSELHNEEKN